jgi:uncharacterized membrane protein YphA (DoxX/SURF4 family)
MAAVTPDARDQRETPTASAPSESPSVRRLHKAAIVRILFGVVWAIDAIFKWLPGFVHGQTLNEELGKASSVKTPVIHQWLQLWHGIGTPHPAVFAVVIAIIETLIALGLILGAWSNLTFITSAVFSFGIWSSAEAFHLPWTRSGITDLGPSVAYIFASLALFAAAAGATWSADAAFLRRRMGRHAWLTSPDSAGLA